MINFKYQALNVESQEIRLIKASSPEHGVEEKISLTMCTVSVRNPPPFVALSYAWGEPQLVCPVRCNSQRLVVTKNLAQALGTALRRMERNDAKEGEEIFLWVDGICINQDDNVEKASQIPLMKDIYKRALYVIGYIGAPETTSPRDAFIACWELSGTDTLHGVHIPNVDWEALDQLILQPWFTRSWVNQEVVLASHVLCLYGNETDYNSWDLDMWIGKLSHSVKMVGHAQKVGVINAPPTDIPSVSLTRVIPIIDGWRVLRAMLQRSPDGLDPVGLLAHGRRTDARDHRDKIYSCIGLFTQEDRNKLKVDYSASNSAAKTFIDFAEFYIRSGRGIQLLEHAGISQRIPELPSWAPDWTQEHQYPLEFQKYSCAGSTRASVSVTAQPGRISVHGWKVGYIARLGPAFTYPVCDGVLGCPEIKLASLEHIAIAAEGFAYEMCKSMADSNDCIRGEKFSDVVWRTLWLDRFMAGRRCNASDRKYYKAWLAKYPRTLEDSSGKDSTPKLINASRAAEQFAIGMAYIAGRAFCEVSGGLFGMVPSGTRLGDIIAVFLGGRVPFVLRSIAKTGDYQIVGSCYVHSVMDGELLDESGEEPRTVTGDVFEGFLIR